MFDGYFTRSMGTFRETGDETSASGENEWEWLDVRKGGKPCPSGRPEIVYPKLASKNMYYGGWLRNPASVDRW